jgi:hypothetical protein
VCFSSSFCRCNWFLPDLLKFYGKEPSCLVWFIAATLLFPEKGRLERLLYSTRTMMSYSILEEKTTAKTWPGSLFTRLTFSPLSVLTTRARLYIQTKHFSEQKHQSRWIWENDCQVIGSCFSQNSLQRVYVRNTGPHQTRPESKDWYETRDYRDSSDSTQILSQTVFYKHYFCYSVN